MMMFGRGNDNERSELVALRAVESEGRTPETNIKARIRLVKAMLKERLDGRPKGYRFPPQEFVGYALQQTLEAGEEMLAAIKANDMQRSVIAGMNFGAAWTQLKFKFY